MHHALSIDEILENVLRYVGQSGDIFIKGVGRRDSRTRDLAAMARTCHTFSALATDVLWSRLDDLTPLLMRLPDDLVSKRRVPSQYREMLGVRVRLKRPTRFFELQRTFGANDWHIFFKYAARVIDLKLSMDTDVRIHPDIYDALCHAPSKPLFPRLRALRWAGFEHFSFLKQLFGPTLLDLSMRGALEDDEALDAFSAAGDLCPNVRTFCWENSYASADEVATVAQVVRAWRNIETLTCSDLDDTTLKHIMSLKSLRHFHMCLSSRLYSVANDPDTTPFPGIFSFSFSVPSPCTLSAVGKLVRALHPSRSSPREFVASAKDASADSLTDLSEAMTSSLDEDLLAQVNITEDGRPMYHTISLSALKPLFSFRSLSLININTNRTVIVDDDALVQMGEAWPKLTSFSINKDHGWSRNTSASSPVTLQGVRAMLKKLPLLRTLALAVDGDSVSASHLDDGNYGTFRIERPFRLDLLDSKINETSHIPAVAAFLADVFPRSNAREMIHAWPQSFELEIEGDGEVTAHLYRQRWRAVVDTMNIINQVKQLEIRQRYV